MSTQDEYVTPTVHVVDRSRKDLGIGALLWVNGSYSSTCRDRTGEWSARITGDGDMSNPQLSVLRDDIRCKLTLTEIVADDTYLSSPAITLDVAYSSSGSSFATLPIGSAANPVAFFGNAKLSSLVFGPYVGITLVVSDNMDDTNGATNTTYVSVSPSGSESLVRSPDYSIGLEHVVIQVDINGVIDSATGFVDLIPGSNLAESYVVSSNPDLTQDFAEIDAEYLAGGAPKAIGATIPVSELDLAGAECPVARAVILAHTESGVRAYEVVRIAFAAP